MSTPGALRRAARSKSPWHHGNLLPALIEATDALVAEGGRDAVSFRAVAGRVKKGARAVTHTAAMAHVDSLTELLAHVAAGWWERLAKELGVLAADDSTPSRRLVTLGTRYHRFAGDHPRHFRLMYDQAIWRAIEVRGGTATNGVVEVPAVPGFKDPSLTVPPSLLQF